MKIRGLILFLALLSAPEALAAQRPSAPERAEESRESRGGPVDLLLRRRDRLDLSEEQVSRLEEIRRRMEERNRPLVSRLLQMRREIRAEFGGSRRELEPARREEYRRRVEAARPLLREIRENNRAAMREVGEVLTRRQKERVRRMLRDHGDDDRKRKGDGRGRRGRGL
jgi:Spy/CpxP family protein refolding chaperone